MNVRRIGGLIAVASAAIASTAACSSGLSEQNREACLTYVEVENEVRASSEDSALFSAQALGFGTALNQAEDELADLMAMSVGLAAAWMTDPSDAEAEAEFRMQQQEVFDACEAGGVDFYLRES